MLGEEITWYQKIGSTASAVKDKVKSPIKGLHAPVYPERAEGENQARDWDVPAEPRQWHAFDFAEAMEQGIAPGLSSSYVAVAEEDTEVRVRVERAQDRRTYQLSTSEGQVLLVARQRPGDKIEFDIFVGTDSDPPRALGPAFTLTSPAKAQWVLTSLRCEECDALARRKCGVRELARITQYSEAVGEGKAFCMDVELPHMDEHRDRLDVWCKICRERSAVEDRPPQVLTSRRPRWNPRHKSLTLDFRGRCSLASAKNFQLEARGKPGKTSKLLFGKVAAHSFVLDYSAPLGAVQAFAASLTASHWK